MIIKQQTQMLRNITQSELTGGGATRDFVGCYHKSKNNIVFTQLKKLRSYDCIIIRENHG